jgi:hypothetical protein
MNPYDIPAWAMFRPMRQASVALTTTNVDRADDAPAAPFFRSLLHNPHELVPEHAFESTVSLDNLKVR